MRDLIKGWGLVKVLWVEAYKQGTIRLIRVCEGQYPLSRPRHWGYDTLGDHVIQCALYLLSVLYGYLPMGVLDWGMEGSVLMVYVPGMLLIVSKELGKACFRAKMSQDSTIGRVAASARLGLRGLRAILGWVLLEREVLCGIMMLTGLLNLLSS